MSGFSYPQPTFISTAYNPAFYLSLDSSGYLTYKYAQTLYIGKNDYRLTYLSGVSPGTATNNSALVLSSTGSINGINSLSATTLTGSLSTASQTNITSIGTLTGLTINGSLNLTGSSRSISLIGSGSYINATRYYQSGVNYDLSTFISGLPSLINVSTIGIMEANRVLSADSSNSLTIPVSPDSGYSNGITFGPNAKLWADPSNPYPVKLTNSFGGLNLINNTGGLYSSTVKCFNIDCYQTISSVQQNTRCGIHLIPGGVYTSNARALVGTNDCRLCLTSRLEGGNTNYCCFLIIQLRIPAVSASMIRPTTMGLCTTLQAR